MKMIIHHDRNVDSTLMSANVYLLFRDISLNLIFLALEKQLLPIDIRNANGFMKKSKKKFQKFL